MPNEMTLINLDAPAPTEIPTPEAVVTDTPAAAPAPVSADGLEAYCVKCKTSRVMKDVRIETAKNGKPMAKGVCPECGTKMSKFLSKAAADKLQAA